MIGAGPAGLAAAEVASASGARVDIFDRMPSPARKFLMAGKSGLNVTTAREGVADVYGCDRLRPMLDAFGPNDIRAWMDGLGQASFVGSTGRV
ncbi:MAG: NAD(P)/FAD-dependent oxidoreductase, partial [Pseudomonadota bacterium]